MLKGGEFIVKESELDTIFIPEEWSEEQLMIKDMVKDFCKKEIIEPMKKSGKELDASKDKEEIVALLDKSAALGFCGMSIEQELGGMDLDFNTGLLFGEAIASGFSFATTIGAQTSIGSLPIVYYGTEEQKKKYLPKIASAEYKASYALTEPSAGSDANSGKTKAIPTADGQHYILNGQKMWITNGGFAHIFIVFAKIEDDRKLSAFIVEKAFGGITLGEEEKKLGIKGSSTVQVFFNDCKVPAENLLAKRGEGFKIALNILNSGRIKLSAGAIGGSKFALSQGIEYAVERKQFKKSISEFGAIKFKIGEMATKIFATESAVYRTGKYIDVKEAALLKDGATKNKAKIDSLREFAVECAILKVYGSEVLDYCVDETLQIYGGMGYSAETGIEMGYRDARITRIYEGTNEINRMLSFGELMKRAMQTKEIDIVTPGKKIPKAYMSQMFSSSYSPGQEVLIVANMKRLFLAIAGIAGQKLKLKMIDEQEIVMNLSDILAEAYISESILLRVQKLRSTDHDKKKMIVMEQMLQLHLYQAIERIKVAANHAIDSLPEGTKQGLQRKMVKRFARRYEVNPKDLRRSIATYFTTEKSYNL
ncbi:MAG: alkylation response protein AidB-like acyl-CoA dehydrogenase [Parvicellaceae bacterium]|jgi:alkylation response protein AidB-like acyl-CoA dehydrogenase